MDLVSVIIPVYQVEKYLERCVDSVINQTYKHLEIILIDDGSIDSCPLMCDNFAEIDKRIKVIHKKNGGLSSARNAGLEIATGKYCYFLDSDDYIVPEAIEVMCKSMSKANSDLLIFNHKRINEKGELISETSNPEWSISILTQEQLLKVQCDYLRNKFCFEVWGKFFLRDIIKQNHLIFESNKEIFAEDICFILHYLKYCKTVSHIKDCLYIYLVRDSSIMGKQNGKIMLKQFSNLCYTVYLYYKKDDYLKKNYYLIFSGIISIQYGQYNILQITNSVSDITHRDFFENCSRNIIANLKDMVKYYGKRGMVYQLLYSKIVICKLNGKKLNLKLWQLALGLLKSVDERELRDVSSK